MRKRLHGDGGTLLFSSDANQLPAIFIKELE